MEQQKSNPMIEVEAHNKKRSFHDEKYGFFSSSDSEASSVSSTESDSFEEVTSSTSSFSSSTSTDPLNNMSSLLQQLPLKRGLSKFYQGKSQSFTSLTNVKSLEDLVKPENSYNKKLKSCKSYGEGLGESQGSKCDSSVGDMSSRLVSKKGVHSANSRGSCSSLSARRGSVNFMGSRPPIPTHRSSTSTTNIPNQTALFA